MLPAPAVAATVPLVQVVVALGGFATIMPLGKLSVNVALLTDAPELLVTVIFRADVWPMETVEGVNVLASVAPVVTVTVLAVTPLVLQTAGVTVLQTAVLAASALA